MIIMRLIVCHKIRYFTAKQLKYLNIALGSVDTLRPYKEKLDSVNPRKQKQRK